MEALTDLQVIGAADAVLTASGYHRIPDDEIREHWPGDGRIYEDRYGIVGVRSFETVPQLLEGWRDIQQGFVDVISAFVRRDEAKAWDGYLLIFTVDPATTESGPALSAIRYDTARVRKLVATGESLRTLADVERVLIPFLPLQPAGPGAIPVSALELLPQLLMTHGIDRDVSEGLLDAWDRQSSLIRALRVGDDSAP